MPFPFIPLLGAVQAVTGFFKESAAEKEAKRLRASRTPFKTSEQIYNIEAATENAAQNGFDPATLEYLTNNIDQAATGALGTAKRLGANPNDLSAIFDQQMQALFKVGSSNAALKMEKFSKYLGAEELLSKNLDAEWASKQGMIKDDLQSANQNRQEGTAQLSGGLNNIIAGFSAAETAKLYSERTDAINGANAGNPIQRIDAGVIETIPTTVTVPRATVNTGVPSQSVSQTVTPESNFTRGRTRIIGIDENGELIYGK